MRRFPELYNSKALHTFCTLTLMASEGGRASASLSHQSMLEHDCRRLGSNQQSSHQRTTHWTATDFCSFTDKTQRNKECEKIKLVISFVRNLVGESVLVQSLYEVTLFRYQRFSSSIIPFIQGKWSFLPLRLYFRADISLHFASPAATLWCSRSPPVHLYLTFISLSAFPSIRLPFPALGGKGLRGSSTALCFHCQSSVNHIDLGRFLHFTGYYMLSLSCVYVWNSFPLELTKIPEPQKKVPLADEYQRWGGTLGRTCDQTPSSAYGHSF